MAACSLGGATQKFFSVFTGFTKTKHGRVGTSNEKGRAQVKQHAVNFADISQTRRSMDSLAVRCCSTTESAGNVKGSLEEVGSSLGSSLPFSNSLEVESLLTEICNTASIAEFKLKLGGFQLYVLRDLDGRKEMPLISPTTSTASNTETTAKPDVVVAESNGSVATTSLAISKPKTSGGDIQRLLDAATDEGLMILQSPKVGFFRRSKTIKGKRAPPSCKEKQIVKEGQVLCYIEQLGGEVPIESDVAGEVIKILRKDGEPVGYGDALISILPAFPGIKKLQ